MSRQTLTRPSWHLREFDRPLYVASHFGFLPVETPKVTSRDLEAVKDCTEELDRESHLRHLDPAEKAAFLRMYLEKEFSSLPHPLSVAYKKHEPGRKSSSYSLQLVGFAGGLAEAILVRSAISMLSEEGYKRLIVDVNCIGDKESISTYERELANFAKRSAASLSTELKKELRRDPFNIFKLPHEELAELRESAPASIAFLSAASRAYFKEVLEGIESLGVDFRLAPELIGNRRFSSHTIFAIRDADSPDEKVLAIGHRYSRLSRRFGFKKESPLIGVSVTAGEKLSAQRIYKEIPNPKFYLVQLGREAKMKSLSIIELLRRERVPVYHFLGRDKITAQLSTAESLKVPYLIIIGHKEALDNTATVRNMSTRSQDTVPVSSLAQYLKNIPF